MKKAVKIAAIAFSLMLVLSGCNLIQFDQQGFNKVVVGKVGDKDIYMEHVLNLYKIYRGMYGLTDENENTSSYREYALLLKESILNTLVQEELFSQLADAKGLKEYTAEEKADAEAKAQKDLDKLLEDYIEQYKDDEDVEDVEAAAREALEDYLASINANKESITQDYLDELYRDKLKKTITDPVTISDEEVRAYYDDNAETQQELVYGSASSYQSEYETGKPLLYNLGGYVRVKHILVGFTSAIRTEISNMRNDGKTEEADKKRDEELAKIKEKAEDVLKLAQEAKDEAAFTELMDEKSEDTGMASGVFHEKGYLVGKDSNFVKEFIDASLALDKPGDISGLVAADTGYHILYLVAKQQAGKVSYENAKAEIHAFMLSGKQTTVWDDAIKQWEEEYAVKRYTDKF